MDRNYVCRLLLISCCFRLTACKTQSTGGELRSLPAQADNYAQSTVADTRGDAGQQAPDEQKDTVATDEVFAAGVKIAIEPNINDWATLTYVGHWLVGAEKGKVMALGNANSLFGSPDDMFKPPQYAAGSKVFWLHGDGSKTAIGKTRVNGFTHANPLGVDAAIIELDPAFQTKIGAVLAQDRAITAFADKVPNGTHVIKVGAKTGTTYGIVDRESADLSIQYRNRHVMNWDDLIAITSADGKPFQFNGDAGAIVFLDPAFEKNDSPSQGLIAVGVLIGTDNKQVSYAQRLTGSSGINTNLGFGL